MLFFGIVCLWETAACAKVFKDLGSEPVTITLENCHYEYRLHRPQGSGRLTGENDRRTYIFDVDGLDKKMLREINEQHGQCKVTYYENTRSVVSVEY